MYKDPKGALERVDLVIFSPLVRTELRFYSRTLEIAEFCNAIERDMHSAKHPSRYSVHLSCGKYAESVVTSVTLEADSYVKLDHISLNRFRYFLDKNYSPLM